MDIHINGNGPIYIYNYPYDRTTTNSSVSENRASTANPELITPSILQPGLNTEARQEQPSIPRVSTIPLFTSPQVNWIDSLSRNTLFNPLPTTTTTVPLRFTNTDVSGLPQLITDVFSTVFQIDPQTRNSVQPTSVTSLFEGSTLMSPTEDMVDNEDNTCAICHNTYSTSDILRKLNRCNHVFHASCVERWFTNNDSCPVCRNRLSES